MGSSKKHKDKDRERDKKREREKRHDRDRQRKRSRSPRDRDERYERRKEDMDEDYDRKKSRIDDDDDLLQYAMEEARNEEASELPQQQGSAGGDVSLSIEETNKLRIKLGLKPLQVENTSEKSNEEKTSLLEDVHVPAVNLSEKEQQEKMKRKLEEIREKRKVYKKLKKVKALGDSGSDDDISASAWVKKSRKKGKEKELAEKRAQMLAEMDEEFGIGELINEEFGPKSKTYTSRDLRGLKVEHDQSNFKEGVMTILTLKDQGILEDEEDTLYNINIEDKEKADKNTELRKKKPAYQPYDESDESEMFKMRGVLEKYDEEIQGAERKSFALDSRGTFNASKEDDLERMRAKLKNDMVSLQMEKPKLATEYYTEEEMVKFKKPKKKRKVRKREVLKVDDLENITSGTITGSGDHGSREVKSKRTAVGDGNYGDESMDIAPLELNSEENFYHQQTQNNAIVLEDDEAQLELEIALQRSRRAKSKKVLSEADKIAQVLAAAPKQEISDDNKAASIVINSTSEFCRTLGEIPTYGASGNREEDEDEDNEWQMDVDHEHREPQGGWEWVKAQDEKKNNDAGKLEEDSQVLDEEPIVGSGMAAALQLASKKGLLNVPGKQKTEEKFVAELPFVGVIDEDKMRKDDKDRSRFGRDRDYERDKDRYRVEKEGYKPNIKLDYVDEHGRQMTPKEAFRFLSHRFHGKMPAKMKTEKRNKKLHEDIAMQKMSSVDTPLNTAALLKEKQKEAQSPYLILSGGGNTFSVGTTIAKKK